MMKKQATDDYKFRNPVTNQIEPKTSYNERHGDLCVTASSKFPGA